MNRADTNDDAAEFGRSLPQMRLASGPFRYGTGYVRVVCWKRAFRIPRLRAVLRMERSLLHSGIRPRAWAGFGH